MGEGSKNTVVICDWSYQHVRDAYNCNKFYVSLKVTIKKKVLKKLKAGKKITYKVSYGGITVSKKVKVKK